MIRTNNEHWTYENVQSSQIMSKQNYDEHEQNYCNATYVSCVQLKPIELVSLIWLRIENSVKSEENSYRSHKHITNYPHLTPIEPSSVELSWIEHWAFEHSTHTHTHKDTYLQLCDHEWIIHDYFYFSLANESVSRGWMKLKGETKRNYD